MIKEFIFFIGLFLSGLSINSVFGKKVPSWFKIASAFFMGVLNWILISLIFLVFLNGTNTYIAIPVVIAESLICLFISLFKQKLHISKKTIALLVIYFLLFSACEYLSLTRIDTTMTKDTIFYVLFGKDMMLNSLGNLKFALPGSLGFFTSLMQAPATALGVGFIRSFHPLLTFSFILFIVCWSNFDLSKKVGYVTANLIATAALFLMFSSSIMQFMFSYIHSNNACGIYLFLAIFSYYEYLDKDREKSWLVLGSLYLAGFCLFRVESNLITLLLLLLLSHFLNLTYKEKLRFLLPNAVFAILVNLACAYADTHSPINALLGTTMQYGLMAVELAFIGYLLISGFKPIGNWIDKYFEKVVPILITLAVAFAFITKFSHMFFSFKNNLSSFFVSGAWGTTWFIVFLLIGYLWNKSDNKFTLLLKYFTPSIYLIILMLSYVSSRYHDRWTNSANRMFVQLFYVCILFLITSLVSYFRTKRNATNPLSSSEPEKLTNEDVIKVD
jgi:hypothetical protein